jgi:hypothetical protein
MRLVHATESNATHVPLERNLHEEADKSHAFLKLFKAARAMPAALTRVAIL